MRCLRLCTACAERSDKAMSEHSTDPLAGVHPPMLRSEHEAGRKRLGIGQSVERALAIAGLTKQDAAFQLGYSDQGVMSRWCSGIERPQFDKLFAIDGFEEAFIKARAEQHPAMTCRTVIEIQHRRRA